MRRKTVIKYKRERNTKAKRPLKYDATFDDILDLIVGSDKKPKKSYRLLNLR